MTRMQTRSTRSTQGLGKGNRSNQVAHSIRTPSHERALLSEFRVDPFPALLLSLAFFPMLYTWNYLPMTSLSV